MKQVMLDILDKITIVETDEELAHLLENMRIAAQKSPCRLAFINAHGFNMACKDPAFAADLLACDYVFRDGSGMKILYKMMGRRAGLNLNGTDLIPRIIALYGHEKVALMGTSSPYLERAGKILARSGAQIVAEVDGFHETEEYLAAAEMTKPDLIILAMGMPKQERIAGALATQRPQQGGLIICGGAILDFIGGKVTRAPSFLRRIGMEWFYRLILEPKRLFGRYVLGNGVFLMRAVGIMIASKRRHSGGFAP